MNGRILVDTNILIELLSGNERIAAFIDGYEIGISFITEIELMSKPQLSKSELNTLKKLLNNFTKYDILTEEIKMLASMYRRNKIIRKTPDAIILATAGFYNLPLLTMDADFQHIKEVDIIFIK
ncbi:MAG: PIN domain-containing protein [Bacteroidetes bacterium]|nr:PIN domain-containing protein [Bacteroidota bacterium]